MYRIIYTATCFVAHLASLQDHRVTLARPAVPGTITGYLHPPADETREQQWWNKEEG